MTKTNIDLLSFSPYGGCSAKLDPTDLAQLLSGFSLPSDPRLLVGADTHDDAGVYLISPDRALIFTTDFFPPVVADPYDFGRIAAVNALSDVFAMGGSPLLVLNLVHYPAESLPLEGLRLILEGAQSAVEESGAMTVGGHTIQDTTPQFGLAVLGEVSPTHLITNRGARPSDLLLLTKPLGTGAILAAHRLGLATDDAYRAALKSMCRLNRYSSACMRRYPVCCGTDVTGFGLVGHALHLAEGSDVTLHFHSSLLPLLPQAEELVADGCIPGGTFRNLRYAGRHFQDDTDGDCGYLLGDPQTSGGLLVCVPPDMADDLLCSIRECGDTQAAIVGEVSSADSSGIRVHLLGGYQ